MTFEPGQKVVCVDADGALMLTLKAIYTVKWVKGPFLQRWRGKIVCEVSIYLAEAETEAGYEGFAADRFRPIQERATDISVFREMLIDIPVDA